MENKEEVKEVETSKVVKASKPKKTSKPKIKKTLCELIKDVRIGDEVVKKGTKYPLTDIGIKYFKRKKYIN